MNLLVLTPLVPYPPHDGDKLRLYHFLVELRKRGHVIDLFCLTRVKDDARYAPELLRLCRRIHIEHLTPFDLFFNVLGALITGRSLNGFSYFSPRFRDALRAYAHTPEGERTDCVLAHRLRMTPYAFEHGPRKPVVLELTDPMTLVSEQMRKTPGVRLSRRFAAMWDRGVLWEEEKEAIEKASRSIFVSPSDAVELQRRGVENEPLAVIPNGVAFEKGRLPRPMVYPAGVPVVAFVGNMGYPPNEEGAHRFLRNVWPHVKREVPDAVFVAAGGFPRASLRRLGNGRDIHVTGYLPSIEPYVLHADVTVAPLGVAVGMQNKVALSLALGVPVVSTPESVAWLPEKVRGWLAPVSGAEAFARAVVEALRKPAKARKKARRIGAFIRSNYRWDKSGALLDAVLKDAVRTTGRT